MPESEVEDKQQRDEGTAHAAKALPSPPQKQVKPQLGVSSVAWQAVNSIVCVSHNLCLWSLSGTHVFMLHLWRLAVV